MKILITGKTGLAQALYKTHHDDVVTYISRGTGHDINNVTDWGSSYIHYDLIYNCAYHGMGQLSVLEFFYSHWKDDESKTIVNIGSRVTYYPRSESKESYWQYKVHKQALQSAFEQMVVLSKCNIKLINPGPIDTDMISHLSIPKFNPQDLADRIKSLVLDRTIRRIDLWV